MIEPKPITEIALDAQIITVLRARKLKHYSFCDSEEIALQLDRPRTQVVMRLNDLYNNGHISRVTDSIGCKYQIAPNNERTPGCCCCCNEKLFDSSHLFCQTCGPHFSGRV